MILKQYYLRPLAQASYLVGDEASKTAAVVDPQRDVSEYLADAERLGLSIRLVILTHFHADFISGHLELARRAGAAIALGEGATAEFPFRPMREGEPMEWGATRLSFLATPGHTPESTSIVVHDLSKDAETPQAVLTGDTLFIGDVGRPDLLASIGVTAADLAGSLYDSLRGKLLSLPDATLVYPAHGAGSMCGKSLSKETVSTIGAQRKTNYALQPMSRGDFVRLVTSDQPEPPRYFAYDAALNKRNRPTLEESLAKALRPLPLAEALRLANQGSQLLDARSGEAFEAGFLPGSVNIGLDGSFETWAGTVLDPARPIVLVAEPGAEREAALRLGRIGFDAVAGYLEKGGLEAARKQGGLLRTIERIDAATLRQRLASAAPPAVLDVRTDAERKEAAIPGSLHIPLPRLLERAGELPPGPLAVHCAGGYRSAVAASLLAARGRDRVADLGGGFAAWAATA